MADRPNLSLETQAVIERERARIFQTALSKYDLLFGGSLIEFPEVSVLAQLTNLKHTPPIQKQAANLKLQFQHYSAELFDATASHLIKIAQDQSQLKLWLEDLVAATESE